MSQPILGVARRDLARSRAEPVAEGIAQPVPFWDSVTRATQAGWRDQIYNTNEGGREAWWQERLLTRHREIERITGRSLPFSTEMERSVHGSDALYSSVHDPYDPDPVFQASQATALAPRDYEARIDALRRQHPGLSGVGTRAQLQAESAAGLEALRAEASSTMAQGVGGALGGFVGGTAAAMIDLPNIIAAISTGGWGAGRPVLTRMLAQSAAGGLTEAAQAPSRASAALAHGGPEYSGQDALADIALGAAAGGAFEAVAGAGAAALRAVGRMRGDSPQISEPDQSLEALFGGEVSGSGGQMQRAADDRASAQALERSGEAWERGLANQFDQLADDVNVIGTVEDFDGARALLHAGGPPPPDWAPLRPVVARLTGRELGEAAEWPALARSAKAALEPFKGQPVRSAALGQDVRITSSGINKATRSASAEVMRALPAIREVLADGLLLGSEPDRYGRRNVRAVHRLGATVEIDGQPQAVVAMVREDNAGNIWWGLFGDDGRPDGAGTQAPAIRGTDLEPAPGAAAAPNMGGSVDEINLTVEPTAWPPEDLMSDLTGRSRLSPTAPGAAARAAAAQFDAPAGPGQAAQLKPKPEDAALEARRGLDDDLTEDVDLERAAAVLRACAPGTG